MVHLSLAARIRLDVEALNMAESIGNYVRRRRAPVIVESDGELRIGYVPAISGESIAHAYQENLANIAKQVGLPVCEYCERGIFLKHSDDKFFEKGFDPKKKKPEQIEEHIVKTCVVEDVGGFLYPGGPSKRTSRISFGYLVPVRDAIKATAVEPQFHVRYDPLQPGEGSQAIYNVEVSTGLYGVRAELNISGIGVSSFSGKPIVDEAERKKRVETAIKALGVTLGNMSFGAKRTRFFPSDWEIISAVAAISDPIAFTASSPRKPDYIEDSVRRASVMLSYLEKGSSKINETIRIAVYPKNAVPKIGNSKVEVEGVGSFEELIDWVLGKVLSEG